MESQKNASAGDLLRFWRTFRKMSQMDLALEAGVSTRHLSFVETGRSRPGRGLILKIAHSLKLPIRHRNGLLKAAGHAAEPAEEPFGGEKMGIIRQALQRMLDKHEPYPAFVVNSAYDILMANSGCRRLITTLAGENALRKHDNVYLLTFAEDGLRPYIRDWPAVERFLLNRLRDEAAAAQNRELFSLYDTVERQRTGQGPLEVHVDDHMPVMRLTFEKDGMTASFFTMITTLGTPLAATTQELRLESLFPADEDTKNRFSQETNQPDLV